MIYKGIINNCINKPFRRELRVNQTVDEYTLWEELRNRKLGVKFRRQYGVNNYILDFYCPEFKLDVEVDGKDHLTKLGKRRDEIRDTELRKMGIEVIRFWSSKVRSHLEEVLSIIELYLINHPRFSHL